MSGEVKPGFLDIAPRVKPVPIGDVMVVVAAISLGDIATLALRFKPFNDLISGRGFNMPEVAKLGGPVVAALIAAALGHLGDEAYEAKAATLSAGEQGELLVALFEVSFPESVRIPFVQSLASLFNIRLDAAAPQSPASSESDPPA